MSWGTGRGGNSFSRGGYQNEGNYNGNWGNSNRNGYNKPNYNRQDPNQKKHTGAKHKRVTIRKGDNAGVERLITIGWNYTRSHGLITFFARTTNKSTVTKSKSEREWISSIAVTVTDKFKHQSTAWGLMERATGKVIISDLGIVINPSKNFCGGIGRKK